MQIDNDKGYVDPLLSNLAVDYSARARADLVVPDAPCNAGKNDYSARARGLGCTAALPPHRGR